MSIKQIKLDVEKRFYGEETNMKPTEIILQSSVVIV